MRPDEMEYRHRVLYDLIELGEDMVFAECREFKTLKGANAFAETKRSALVQTARVVWLTADEEAEEVRRIEAGEPVRRM